MLLTHSCSMQYVMIPAFAYLYIYCTLLGQVFGSLQWSSWQGQSHSGVIPTGTPLPAMQSKAGMLLRDFVMIAKRWHHKSFLVMSRSEQQLTLMQTVPTTPQESCMHCLSVPECYKSPVPPPLWCHGIDLSPTGNPVCNIA